jgi:hypothetical protein
MSSIRITKFAGLRPSVDPRQLDNSEAQIAHNCLLEDGSLQAMPQWQVIGPEAVSLCLGRNNDLFEAFAGSFAIDFLSAPFGAVTIYLDGGGNLLPSVSSSASGTVSITPGLLSKKPVNRIYGVTSVLVIAGVSYESPLTLMSGIGPQDIMYEGDIATLTVACTGTYARIYRSTSDVTTGAGTNGAVTANWQLVQDNMPNGGVFVEGGSAVANPFDTYLYRGPQRPPFSAVAMGLFESGYVWLIAEDGQIAVSDRFSWGIWPVENVYTLGNNTLTVTGAVSIGDRLYIGTQQGVFLAEAHVTDAGALVLNILPIAQAEPCLPNTMVVTPSGAIYTSAQGVVGLSGNEAVMLTRDIARGVAGTLPAGAGEVLFSQVNQALYHNGRYYAFGGGA